MVVLIRDFINYTRASLNMILEPAWKMLTIHLPIYIHTVCYERNYTSSGSGQDTNFIECPFTDTTAFDEDEAGVEGMTKQLIDLITTLIVNPAIHTLIRTGLAPFVSTLCSYLVLPQADLSIYQHTPLYFMEIKQQMQGDMVSDSGGSIRSSCIHILESLTETFGTNVTEILQAIALDNMNPNPINKKKTEKPTAPAKATKGNVKSKQKEEVKETTFNNVSIYENYGDTYEQHDQWRKIEQGLFLLSFIADDLYVAVEKKLKYVNCPKITEAFQMLCNYPGILKNQLLLGRFIGSAAECVQILPNSNPLCKQFIELACNSLRDDYFQSIRLVACKCIVRYANRIQSLPIKDCGSVIKKVHSILEVSTVDSMHIAIETIATIFQYGTPKQLVHLLPAILSSYLGILNTNECETHDFVDFIRRLGNQSSYIGPVISAFIPLLEPIILQYPKSCEPTISSVFNNLLNVSNCLKS